MAGMRVPTLTIVSSYPRQHQAAKVAGILNRKK
jgi:hypothetical protein